jgi:DNA-binding transcriptional LysR family regulator
MVAAAGHEEDRLEQRQLRYFLTVAEELHFGRARAHRPAGVQPADQATRAGARRPALERTSRRVQLTEPGRVFIDLARGLLDQTNDAIALVRQAGHGREGRLRLAYANGSDRGVPASVVDRFRAEHPLVELTLSTQYDEESRVQLRAGDIDAVFVWMPLGDFDDLACRRVATEPLMVAVAQRHPLAALDQVTPEQVAAEPLVSFARHWSPGSWDTMIASVFLRHGLTAKVVEEASQEGMVRGVVAAAGVTIVTASTARQLDVPGVVYRPFVDPAPSVDIGLTWRANDTSPVLKAVVEIAADYSDTSPD